LSRRAKDPLLFELQHAVDRVAARNTLILAGDFNAQVHAEDPQPWHGCLGDFILTRKKRSVKADKGAYSKVKAFALEAVFAANRVHAAYKHVGLRNKLDRVQSLAAGKLRRSDLRLLAVIQQILRRRQTSKSSIFRTC